MGINITARKVFLLDYFEKLGITVSSAPSSGAPSAVQHLQPLCRGDHHQLIRGPVWKMPWSAWHGTLSRTSYWSTWSSGSTAAATGITPRLRPCTNLHHPCSGTSLPPTDFAVFYQPAPPPAAPTPPSAPTGTTAPSWDQAAFLAAMNYTRQGNGAG